MKIENGSRVYQIGEKVAEAVKYRLFLCKQEETGRECLLQIAAEPEHNGELDRAAYILGELDRTDQKLEKEYAKVKKDPKVLLNYHLGFPELVDSFISSEQGGRRINILAFRNVKEVNKMVPLINITEKDRLRIDLRTSAWVTGKSLKMLVFAHDGGFAVDSMDGNNILLEPDQHYVLIFDWSGVQIYSDQVPIEERIREISEAAQSVIIALGGDPETETIPDDGDEPFAFYVDSQLQKEFSLEELQGNMRKNREIEERRNFYRDKAFGLYSDFLLRLARGGESNVKRAHANFYELVHSLWKREFYPFTTKPL